ncbi:MAG: cytochrome (ubi)quinol oxidase subunit III [Ramlibacter sp.]
MSDAAAAVGPHHLPSRNLGGHAGHAESLTRAHGHDGAKRIVAAYGFWVFLISDIIMFAAFFATYAVLTDSTAGGPSGKDLFDIPNVAIETACLLTSSLFCGVAAIGANARRTTIFQLGMAATFILGAVFLALEIREFADLVAQGNGPQRSAFLSAFFALIGCHGLHVAAGLLWLLTMMAQVAAKGYRQDILRRILCFSLFWHTLDIIWVALFSLVYLVGVAK